MFPHALMQGEDYLLFTRQSLTWIMILTGLKSNVSAHVNTLIYLIQVSQYCSTTVSSNMLYGSSWNPDARYDVCSLQPSFTAKGSRPMGRAWKTSRRRGPGAVITRHRTIKTLTGSFWGSFGSFSSHLQTADSQTFLTAYNSGDIPKGGLFDTHDNKVRWRRTDQQIIRTPDSISFFPHNGWVKHPHLNDSEFKHLKIK